MNGWTEINTGFFADPAYMGELKALGLSSFDAVMTFTGGQNLSKADLPKSRSRLELKLPGSGEVVFLKRYRRTPVIKQIRNWLDHKKIASTMHYDMSAAQRLSQCDIKTPKTIAYGERFDGILEDESFIISARVPGQSLEKKLPPCFDKTISNLKARRNFIRDLADFAAKFHATGFCHRDFYLCHIFYDEGRFWLIDLQRAFCPALFKSRFRAKDIAQLCYSAPSKVFTRTDRMRFVIEYFKTKRLGTVEKKFIQAILHKTKIMARHDRKHGREIVFIP